jgi:Oxidoreductase family, NAD-binding Rossmann fold
MLRISRIESSPGGWGRDAHIPALSALPEFEITAVCTSRQETADETAKHFGFPHAFADPYKMLQHPDVDLVSICVRVPFHHQLGMAALNAGKHLYCEWPLAATTEQAQQMRDLAVRKGVRHMVGLQARGAREFNRLRDLVAEGYVGKVLSCTMIIATPAWGTEFKNDRAYMADRSNGSPRELLMSPRSIMLPGFQPNHSQSRLVTSRFAAAVATDEQVVIAWHTRWINRKWFRYNQCKTKISAKSPAARIASYFEIAGVVSETLGEGLNVDLLSLVPRCENASMLCCQLLLSSLQVHTKLSSL